MLHDRIDSVKYTWASAHISGRAERWLNPAAFVLVGYVVLAILIYWVDFRLLRIGLAVILALFGSGYSLTTVLFASSYFNTLEKFAVAGGLSLAIGGMSGFALAKLPWGLEPGSLLVAAFLFNLLCYIGIVYQRTQEIAELKTSSAFKAVGAFQWVPDANRYRDMISGRWVSSATVHQVVKLEIERAKRQPGWVIDLLKQWLFSQSSASLTFTLILILIIATGTWRFSQMTGTPGDELPITEFYLLNEEGMAGDYPVTVHPDEILSLRYGIVNREDEASTYRVEVMVEGQIIGQSEAVTLDNDESMEAEIDVRWPTDGLLAPPSEHKVNFMLYHEEKPYRSLHLRLNVDSFKR